MTPDERHSAAQAQIAWNEAYKRYIARQLHFEGTCTCRCPIPFVCDYALTETLEEMPF